MAELPLAFGQRLIPTGAGEQHLASTYAVLGGQQIACLGDGTVGTVPLRLAAQIATATALARLRASAFGDAESRIADALLDAHDAVRRGLAGSPQDGIAGAALIVAIVGATGEVVIARVGHGRAYALGAHDARPVFRDAPASVGVGFSRDMPGASWARLTLKPGERLVLMSESAHTVLAADLGRVAHGHGAQLAAQRLGETARRRGQHDAIAIAVFERGTSDTREGPHPAFSRVDRERPRTFDEDGRLLGAAQLERQRTSAGAGRPGVVGWLVWFLFAAMLGAFTALLTRPAPEEAPPAFALGTPEPPPSAPPSPPPAAPAPSLPPSAPAPPADIDPEIAEALAGGSPARIATDLRNYVTRHYPERKTAVFDALSAAFEHHLAAGTLPPDAAEALVALARDTRLKRTAKWAADLLPRLLTQPAPPGE